MSRKDEVMQRRAKGYNCAQAVACAYHDIIGLSEEDVFKITEYLGSGMANTKSTCGAISAACMVISSLTSTVNLEAPNSKGITYKWVREMTDKFEKDNGALYCKDLKGIETGIVIKTCPECILSAVDILEEKLKEMKNEKV